MRLFVLLCLVAVAASESEETSSGDSTSTPTAPTYARLGCYRDTGTRDLPLLVEAKATTVYRCRDRCRKLKYRYSGNQASYCFCGNKFGRYGKNEDSQCNIKCAANREETCGGGWHNSVYSTGVSIGEASLKTLGCFKDQGVRDLPFHSAGTTDVNSCVLRCGNLGYKYAGVQAGSVCFCGDSYGKYGKAMDAECVYPCAANRHQICGGSWHNLIYETGFTPSDREHLGCFVDKGVRDLPDYHSGVMSVQHCISYCGDRGFKYAGVQYSSYCFCGNKYGRYGKADSSNCHMACNGKRDEMCGGPWRNNVYSTGREMEFQSLGCYHDKGTRDLPWLAKVGHVNLNNCRYECASHGYLYFGVQYSSYCFCGNSYGRYGKAADSACTMRCTGNKDDICGGPWLNNIYRTHVKANMGTSSSHTAQSASDALERTLDQSVSSDRTGKLLDISQMKMRYFGCYRDNGERDLPQTPFAGTLDVHYCRWTCRELRYRYFGLQANYCFCGNHFGKYGQALESKCNLKCTANREQTCGGGWHNSLYATNISEDEAKLTPLGCYVDTGDRDLPLLGSHCPIISVNTCVKSCRDLGYKYAGAQNGAWCFCGNKYGRFGKAKDSDCYVRCHANRRQICGGPWRNHVYETHADTTNPETNGCYKDQGVHDLVERAFTGVMSINYCRKLCRELGYKYAGVQYSNQCWCGNTYGRYGKVDERFCNLKCTGHHEQMCGGALYNQIYESGKPEFAFRSMGCYNDKAIRDLPFLAKSGLVNLNNCRQACWRYGYKYFGVQNSNYCFCGDSYGKYGRVEDVRCQKPCLGNKAQICGDLWMNNIYETGVGGDDESTYTREEETKPDETTSSPPTQEPDGNTIIDGGSDTGTSIEKETGTDSSISHIGCFNNKNDDRDLPDLVFTGSVTIQLCARMCAERFYKFAGLQGGTQCFCGNSYGKHGSATECNLRCRGNAQQVCGGKSTITVYTTSVAWKFVSKGCFIDKAARDLKVLGMSGKISVPRCFRRCRDLGYYYAGVQNSMQCFCGNYYNRYGKADDAKCNLKCRGNPTQTCGGVWHNNIYRTTFQETSRTAIGCFKDSADRDLPEFVKTGLMTVNLCITRCSELGYKYAGLQGGNTCYCGNSYGRFGKGEANICTNMCSGNNNQMCGGAEYNLVFETGVTVVEFQSFGCYIDQKKRDLPFLALKGSQVNLNNCRSSCRRYGFLYFGVQNSNECRCGNNYGNYGATQSPEDCRMKCSGNKAQICGGSFVQNIFSTGLSSETVIISQGITSTTTISGDKDEITGGDITVIEGISTGNRTISFEYLWTIITYTDLVHLSFGCFKDTAERDLPVSAAISSSMTVKSCVQQCQKKGFQFAGLQNAKECWCGNQFGRFGPAHAANCNKQCGGEAGTICGGDWHNNIYSTSLQNIQNVVTYFVPKTTIKTITTITYYDENGNPISSSQTTSTQEQELPGQ